MFAFGQFSRISDGAGVNKGMESSGLHDWLSVVDERGHEGFESQSVIKVVEMSPDPILFEQDESGSDLNFQTRDESGSDPIWISVIWHHRINVSRGIGSNPGLLI